MPERRNRTLKIRRSASVPEEGAITIDAVAGLIQAEIDNAIAPLQEAIEILISNSHVVGVILSDLAASAELASSVDGSVKNKLNELLASHNAAFANLRNIKDSHGNVHPYVSRLQTVQSAEPGVAPILNITATDLRLGIAQGMRLEMARLEAAQDEDEDDPDPAEEMMDEVSEQEGFQVRRRSRR